MKSGSIILSTSAFFWKATITETTCFRILQASVSEITFPEFMYYVRVGRLGLSKIR